MTQSALMPSTLWDRQSEPQAAGGDDFVQYWPLRPCLLQQGSLASRPTCQRALDPGESNLGSYLRSEDHAWRQSQFIS